MQQCKALGGLWSTLLHLLLFALSQGSAPLGAEEGPGAPQLPAGAGPSLPLQPGHLQMAGDTPGGGRRLQEDKDVSPPLRQASKGRGGGG